MFPNLEKDCKITYSKLMNRDRFLLDSDQLELLLSFEESKGLSQLAEVMAKDPSVISRGLQRIAEAYPVLIKNRGRWELTPLGRELNAVTKEALLQQKNLLGSAIQNKSKVSLLSKNTALVIINAQCGLLDATQLGRNNSDAEKNIETLLKLWRSKNYPIIHVKHVSDNPSSMFYRSSKGAEFLPGLEPLGNELVIQKTNSSAFHETKLDEVLKDSEFTDLVLTGFTANECIEATARDASALGFSTYVVGDATAMFDMKSPDGKLLKADRLHRLTLANLNAYYGRVIQLVDLL